MSDKLRPSPTPETQPYWDAANERRFQLPRCGSCGTWAFPPRPLCATCSGTTTWQALSGRASLCSYVIHHRPAPGWEPDEVPYVIALVTLEEGVRLLGNLVGVPADPDHLPLDLPLEIDFAARGDQLVPVWRPVGVAP